MDLKKTIADLVEHIIDREDIFLVEVDIKGTIGNQKIQIFIDGDQLLDIDECSKISRKLSDELEDRDIIEGRYIIEVSSPGADKPLKILRQYTKHIGRELEVMMKDNKKYQGLLLNVVDENIELSVSSGKVKKKINAETLKIPFNEVDNCRVIIRL